MKIASLGAVALVLTLASPSQASEAIHGVWVRGGHDNEKLEFYDCDGQLCAKETEPGPKGEPPVVILRHAAKTGPNQWKGDLFNPENSKIYAGTITLDKPNQLTLKGCLIAFLCQSETWTRVAKDATPPAAAAKTPAKSAPAAAKPAPGSAKPTPGAAKPTPGSSKTAPAPDAGKASPDAE
ncbi:MAG: DUF2147 domain-containing protein [Methylocystis sp.]